MKNARRRSGSAGRVPIAAAAFDAERYRSARAKWKPVVESLLGPTTELMLDLAQLSAGACVLDIGAGAGGQTLLAAGRVGPMGRVVATDIAPELLEIAADDARSLGLTNVECRVSDAEELDFEERFFDAAISRNVLMYIPNLPRALRSIHRVLRPGGRLSSVVWSASERNAFLSVFHSIMMAHVRAAGISVTLPDPFRFGKGDSLRTALAKAGFVNVRLKSVAAPWRLPSLNAALDFLKENPSYLLRVVENLADVDRTSAWAEIKTQYEKFESPGGFVAPGELLVVAASKQ